MGQTNMKICRVLAELFTIVLVGRLTEGAFPVATKIFPIPEGNFTSPRFPALYPNDTEEKWILFSGLRVELTFHSLNLQSCPDCSCDYVEVRDGVEPLGPVIGRYCGNHTEPFTVIASGEVMTVHFKTDSSNSGTGFNASYTMTIKCPTLPRKLVGQKKYCGKGRQKNDRNCGEFYITFLDEQECTWYGETGIFRRWEFDFEDEFRFKDCAGCSCEYVEFFDGKDPSTSKSLGRYCGSSKPNDVKTSGRRMSFKIKAGVSSKIHFKYRGKFTPGAIAGLILLPLLALAIIGCGCLGLITCYKKRRSKEETFTVDNEPDDLEAEKSNATQDSMRMENTA